MPYQAKVLFALALASAMALAGPAGADDYITVNGLPCNALCRLWMGIKLPSESTPETQSPRPLAEKRPETREPRREAHKSAERSIARRATKPVKLARASAAPTKLGDPTKPNAASVDDAVVKGVSPSPAVAPEKPGPSPAAAPQPSASSASSAPPAPAPSEKPSPSPTVAASPEPTPSVSAQDAAASASEPQTTEKSAKTSEGDKQPTAPPQIASVDRSAQAGEERRIAIVLTKPDTKDVADLHDKSIVLAGVMNVSDARLKAAFAAAGADGAAFRQGDVKDADEVESGGVAAAILAVVSPEVAGAFPEIPGYRLLRVEVAPEASR